MPASMAPPSGPRFGLRNATMLFAGALALLGCTSEDDESDASGSELGPLAVLAPGIVGGSEALGGTGPVRIEEDCVSLSTSNGNVVLLVWHAADVSWDGGDREITFTDRDGRSTAIRDGDVLTVGGESLTSQDGDPVAREITWLAEPDESCPGERFMVSSLLP